MKSLRRLFVCTIVILTIASVMLAHGRTGLIPSVIPSQTSAAKVEQWLQQSGLNYKKTGDRTWLINYKGTVHSNLQILVATGSDFVVVGQIVAVKNNMRVTSDLMFKLLKLNHALDYVKIGFDEDDDLFVRNEVKIALVDSQQFKANVETVAAASERVQGEIKAFLITP